MAVGLALCATALAAWDIAVVITTAHHQHDGGTVSTSTILIVDVGFGGTSALIATAALGLSTAAARRATPTATVRAVLALVAAVSASAVWITLWTSATGT